MAPTILDYVNHVAGIGYAAQLILMGDAFMNDNLATHITNSAVTTMCKDSGMFIIGMRVAHYIVQTKVKDVEVKKLMTASAGVLWGTCGLLTLSTWGEGKAPNVYVNFGLQFFFAGAYAHQYLTMDSEKKD
ncbi:hypothetical protein TrLO_g5721 [Triparma laevis f. longispina]|uniref:Uncharacterized protein n=1 Tax=Triparma laevis f. longispina TaxID=1714387 RepID=A0A9W7AIM6_9STRA|nr:hypothetical protein TrLO_g5721 [Triparma laevis f. longispina]